VRGIWTSASRLLTAMMLCLGAVVIRERRNLKQQVRLSFAAHPPRVSAVEADWASPIIKHTKVNDNAVCVGGARSTRCRISGAVCQRTVLRELTSQWTMPRTYAQRIYSKGADNMDGLHWSRPDSSPYIRCRPVFTKKSRGQTTCPSRQLTDRLTG
jgi:hypothetical protein